MPNRNIQSAPSVWIFVSIMVYYIQSYWIFSLYFFTNEPKCARLIFSYFSCNFTKHTIRFVRTDTIIKSPLDFCPFFVSNISIASRDNIGFRICQNYQRIEELLKFTSELEISCRVIILPHLICLRHIPGLLRSLVNILVDILTISPQPGQANSMLEFLRLTAVS